MQSKIAFKFWNWGRFLGGAFASKGTQKLGFNEKIVVICILKDWKGVFLRRNGVNIFGPIQDSHLRVQYSVYSVCTGRRAVPHHQQQGPEHQALGPQEVQRQVCGGEEQGGSQRPAVGLQVSVQCPVHYVEFFNFPPHLNAPWKYIHLKIFQKIISWW